ncbi:glucooligosaccharide oxidase [Panaeolus papilionaceus]|nr:glucooligosaccharide oxidase [Panaeolus papilionaceus]
MLFILTRTQATFLPLLTLFVCLTRADLISDLKSHGFQVLAPADLGYASAIIPYNERFMFKPAAVTFPRNTQDVSTIVKISGRYNVTVTARSGGHSYIANGLDGKVVVDLASFKKFSVDPRTKIATLGPGIRLGDLILQLNAVGRAMPHGLCPYVALGGHAGHGGYGHTSRQWGLTLDVIESLEVVLADGKIVTASKSSHPDLFWALRGASSSFGIVTSMKVKTFPVPPTVTNMQYAWDMSTDEATSAVLDWQAFSLASTTPANIGAYLVLMRGSAKGRVALSFMGGYFGPNRNFDKIVQPLFKNYPSGGLRNATAMSYVDAAFLFGQMGTLNTTVIPEASNTLYAKSLMTPQETPMTREAVGSLIEYLGDVGFTADFIWAIEIEQYGGVTSQINKVPLDATAFGRRNALFTLQFLTAPSANVPPFPPEGFTFLDGMTNAILDNMPKDWDYGAYMNYPDDRLKDWQRRYYGSHYPRLQNLKAFYDPKDLFKFPLSIELPN